MPSFSLPRRSFAPKKSYEAKHLAKYVYHVLGGCFRSYNTRLLTLTKSVHQQLPREVRDMIYTYLLTPHEIFNISRCSTLRMDRFPYRHGSEPEDFKTRDKTKANRPYFIDTNLVYPPFAAEVVQMQYEFYGDFWVDMPSAIAAFLDTDFLKLNSTPRVARLSALHVSGYLDADMPNSINTDTLAQDLHSLFDTRWAPNFDIDITFRTELGVTYFDPSAIQILAQTMHAVWQILQPWIEEAESRGARVYFVMLTKAMMYKYMHGGHDMLETEEEWQNELRSSLGHFCIRPSMMPFRGTGQEDRDGLLGGIGYVVKLGASEIVHTSARYVGRLCSKD